MQVKEIEQQLRNFKYYLKNEISYIEIIYTFRTTKSMATPNYTCPTWLNTRQCGTFSDIYSFGLTMLVLMSEDPRTYILNEKAGEIKEGGDIKKLKKIFKGNWKEEVCHSIYAY